VNDKLEFAIEIAHRAGRLLKEHANQQQSVWSKSSEIDLVTEADLAAERLLVDAIRSRYPDHTILSEEGLGDLQAGGRDLACLWMIDPLDGTVNYAHGYPVWAVSIAFAERGQVMLAVTHSPLRNETFSAQKGGGAWANSVRLRVSDTPSLKESLVATGFPYRRATADRNNLSQFGALMPKVQGVRRAGAAVLDLADLAAGRLDAYWEFYLKPWDWGAGCLLVEEAGGVVTDMDGNDWDPTADELAASNGRVHQELLDLLAASDPG
jgi:myo-inositol-1(or 4)-monophosphatase